MYAVAAGALPDGTPVIISGGGDGTVRVWRTGRRHARRRAADRPRPLGARGGGGGAARWHPGHHQRRHDGILRVWRLADGTPVGELLTGHGRWVSAVAAGALPDGTPVIISGGSTSRCGCGGPADGTPVGEPLTGHHGQVSAVAAGVLPDGTPVIISAGGYPEARCGCGGLADGTPVGEPLTGHHGEVSAVAAGALPDGTPVIISGGSDGTVRVWRTADGTPIGEPLTGHHGEVYCGGGRGAARWHPRHHQRRQRQHGPSVADWPTAPRSCLHCTYKNLYAQSPLTAGSSLQQPEPTSPFISQR